MNRYKAQDASTRYLELSSRIRILSAPDIGNVKNPDDYRNTLVENFTEIGHLADEIKELLDNNVYPLLENDAPLSPDQIDLLTGFTKTLVNNTTMDHLDPMLCYRIATRLLSDAEQKNDVGLIIRALDHVVDSAYVMMRLAFRLYPCTNDGFKYLDVSIQASRRLLEYLDKTCVVAVLLQEDVHLQRFELRTTQIGVRLLLAGIVEVQELARQGRVDRPYSPCHSTSISSDSARRSVIFTRIVPAPSGMAYSPFTNSLSFGTSTTVGVNTAPS